MTRQLGGGGIKVKKNKVKDITAAVMQKPRAGWSWEF